MTTGSLSTEREEVTLTLNMKEKTPLGSSKACS